MTASFFEFQPNGYNEPYGRQSSREVEVASCIQLQRKGSADETCSRLADLSSPELFQEWLGASVYHDPLAGSIP